MKPKDESESNAKEEAETLAAIQRGIDQAARGEGIPLQEAARRLLAKFRDR